MMVWFYYPLKPKIILLLLSNPDRYDFFLQFHKKLAKNLDQTDMVLFDNYLKSCREKLQDERNRYHYFYGREWVLTAILAFGIIALAAVLAIYFLEIYSATWFFWLGIVGVVLTVGVGVYLDLCIGENYNEIKPINRAIKFYDLEKIRYFKETEPKKIKMLDFNKEASQKIFNDDEMNTTEQNNDPELKRSNLEQNINGE